MDRYESEPVVSDDDVLTPINGILDVLDNYAFVRTSGYLPGSDDAYVSLSMVKKFGLRKGDVMTGAIRSSQDSVIARRSSTRWSGSTRSTARIPSKHATARSSPS